MLATLLIVAAASAEPVLGVEVVPFSRGDLTWVQEDQTSGTLVGEFDGLVRPAATFHGGYRWGRTEWLAGLGLARLTSTVWTAEGRQQSHVGALRLSATARRALGSAEEGPFAFLDGGFYGIIPSARVVSDSFTEAEQADADEGAAQLRKTIGGLGILAGPGFGVPVGRGAWVGGRLHLVLHRGQRLEEEALYLSVVCYSDAALVFAVRL